MGMAGVVELEGAFSYHNSSLHCEEVDLAALGHNTPCHVYSRSQYRHKYIFCTSMVATTFLLA